MPYVEIRNLHKTYESKDVRSVPVLQGLDLDLGKGEFVSVFGPNGCGKSTLLKIAAGLIKHEQGTVRIDGNDPTDSRIGFVFQNYSESLFPWLLNIDNVGFSLEAECRSKKARRRRVEEFVSGIGLADLPLHKYPYQCSAGQQQLVTLARELIYDPDVLLMDEPFVSLDYDRRLTQQENLLRTWHTTHTTVVFVSHELDEAIYLADRLVLLSDRPAKVVETFEISLARPRRPAMLEDEAFFRLKTPILRRFMRIIGQ